MRSWAKWMVRHKMRWMLYVAIVVSIIPISIMIACINVPAFLQEIADWVRSDWERIGKEK